MIKDWEGLINYFSRKSISKKQVFDFFKTLNFPLSDLEEKELISALDNALFDDRISVPRHREILTEIKFLQKYGHPEIIRAGEAIPLPKESDSRAVQFMPSYAQIKKALVSKTVLLLAIIIFIWLFFSQLFIYNYDLHDRFLSFVSFDSDKTLNVNTAKKKQYMWGLYYYLTHINSGNIKDLTAVNKELNNISDKYSSELEFLINYRINKASVYFASNFKQYELQDFLSNLDGLSDYNDIDFKLYSNGLYSKSLFPLYKTDLSAQDLEYWSEEVINICGNDDFISYVICSEKIKYYLSTNNFSQAQKVVNKRYSKIFSNNGDDLYDSINKKWQEDAIQNDNDYLKNYEKLLRVEFKLLFNFNNWQAAENLYPILLKIDNLQNLALIVKARLANHYVELAKSKKVDDNYLAVRDIYYRLAKIAPENGFLQNLSAYIEENKDLMNTVDCGVIGDRTCKDVTVENNYGPELILVDSKKYHKIAGISRNPVLWRDYNIFCRATNLCTPKNNKSDLPVLGLSKYEVEKYINWLSEVTHKKYRLPTTQELIVLMSDVREILPKEINCRISNKNNKLAKYSAEYQDFYGFYNLIGNAKEVASDGKNTFSIGSGSHDFIEDCLKNNIAKFNFDDKNTAFRVARDVNDYSKVPNCHVDFAGKHKLCADYIAQTESVGPLLTVPPLRDGKKVFAISKLPISNKEYNLFCKKTGFCRVDLQHNDLSPKTNINYDEASVYAAWLSEITGAKYSLPADDEWLFSVSANEKFSCVLPDQGVENEWGIASKYDRMREWVLIDSKLPGLRGEIAESKINHCEIGLLRATEKFNDQITGFRVVRYLG